MGFVVTGVIGSMQIGVTSPEAKAPGCSIYTLKAEIKIQHTYQTSYIQMEWPAFR